MAFEFEVTRPDDLPSLRVKGANLRLDVSDSGSPVLVVDNVDEPAYLVGIFPPQAIAETAYFQPSSLDPEMPALIRTGLPT